ncbi:pPIWI_RE module domain-containing protein [Lederbergia ruris]|uniref:pPIWI_RE module domain-containing protein n=1 Tax=Lederbergia ruris TaxID=217495 RepID=UPI0039A282E8
MDKLELFSFELDERTFENETVYYLQIPKSWHEYLDSKRKGVNYYQLSIKPTTLGNKLQTLFPNIFYVNWIGELPWLLADEETETNILKTLCLKWFANEEKVEVNQLPIDMQEEELEWKQTSMRELHNENELMRIRFNWVPALIARKLARKQRVISIEDGFTGELDFKHVNFNGKHECMSQLIRKKEKMGAFAYVIRFEYKTRGSEPERGILNVSIGMRRFLQQPIQSVGQIHKTRKGSILIGVKNPFYMLSDVKSMSYWKYERKNGKVEWQRGIDKLFADVMMQDMDLNPMHVLEHPQDYIRNDEFEALAVYSDLVYMTSYNLSKVLPGVGLPEKWALFNLIKDVFPELKQLEQATKVKDSQIGKQKHPLLHSYDENLNIRLEVWNEQQLSEELIAILKNEELINQKNEDGSYLLNTEPVMSLEIVDMNSKEIVHALEFNKYGDKAEKYHIKKVMNKLKPLNNVEEIVVSLIEIDEKEKWIQQHDPKQAIRTGFANTGRITQFIYPRRETEKEKERKGRVVNSIYDLLMDLGFLPSRIKNLTLDNIILWIYVNI